MYTALFLMIPLFKKLEREKLLKSNGVLLDLGGGDGNISEPFYKFGYSTIIIDKDEKSLEKARGNFELRNELIENFKFDKNYDGIIISNVLPFLNNKQGIKNIINTSFDSLNSNGFLYFTLFGEKDQWNKEGKKLSFYGRRELSSILKPKPYFVSEDFGVGSTKKGEMKKWHVYSFLYIKRQSVDKKE